MLAIECIVDNVIWRFSPIPIKHVFLNPHLTTRHSNIGIRLQKVVELHSQFLLGPLNWFGSVEPV